MQQSVQQILFSLTSSLVGGGIAIATQWLIAREKEGSENREKLKTSKLEKYSTIWSWLCSYDVPSNNENLESIHTKYYLSYKKYWELRTLVIHVSPFTSNAMSTSLKKLLIFWEEDLKSWRGTHQICDIQDRPCPDITTYTNLVEDVFISSQIEINELFKIKRKL